LLRGNGHALILAMALALHTIGHESSGRQPTQLREEGQLGIRGRLLALAAAMYAVFCAHAHADPETKPLTSSAAQALRVLKSLPREWSGTSDHDCKTYEDKNIDKLSRPFAVSAAAFLEAFVNVHGEVTITSAHRTEEEQTCVCVGEKGPCAGRPRIVKKKKGKSAVVRSVSHHQLGIALDVRAGTGSEDEFICLQEFAQLNPQFGVRFPFGKHDYPHMESGSRPATVKVAALASARTSVTPCNKLRIMLTDTPVD
jgi:hypothetical protein